jgi:uncharacterized protein YndB with AHSA1/START domain
MIQPSTDAIVQEIDYPHPIELVWEALTNNDAVSEWLMKAEGLKPEVGSKFTLTYDDGQGGYGGTVECEVLAVDKPKRLSYTWNSPPTLFTTLTINLESTDGGTHLRLEQTGFESGGEGAEQFRTGADWGWGKKFLPDTLAKYLDKLAARA